uniref:Multiple inositol polyphosphate phosphatase 1 n=1 Tax=Phallusia mammillata TaxID=59560 RepID=A0A6F9DLK2_9ASCI|nr:multiple inositol polyphosphate phosphatase 1-like [Phallusia mammillata]
MTLIHMFCTCVILLLGFLADVKSTSVHNGATSFATKTTYNQRLVSSDVSLYWDKVLDGYDLLYTDGTFRHGTRFPSDEKVEKWRRHVLKISKNDINDTFADTLKLWDAHFPNQSSYMLHEVGKRELQRLAIIIFNMTKDGKYLGFDKKGSVRFMTSPKVRTKQSACSFINQLLCLHGNETGCLHLDEVPTFVESQDGKSSDMFECTGGIPVQNNPMLLRSFDYCPKYSEKVTHNGTADHEVKKFGYSEHAVEVTDHISGKFKQRLNWTEVTSLHQLCAFHFALHRYTAICDLFHPKHLQVMEFANDLKHYYKTGYGYEINYKLSCPLIQDIVGSLDNAATSNGSAGATFRFGHAETIIPLLCILGLYKESEHLTYNSFSVHGKRRLFRTGVFSPFAGNILFLLYRPTGAHNQTKFSIVVNEHVVKIPRANCHVCDYNDVRQQLFEELMLLDCASVCATKQKKDEL